MENTSIQIQSVLFKNSPSDIRQAIESLANAARVAKKGPLPGLRLVLHYGDASPARVFSPEEWETLVHTYAADVEMRYDFFDENTGTAKGHNRLGESCECEYMMIMNPDVVVNPHIFSQLLTPFQDPAAKTGISEARQTPIEHSKAFDKKTGETSWISTACALFPSSIFKAVDGFDNQSFFMYCDDLDFSWRVRLAGYKNIYLPNAPIYHAKRLASDGRWQPTAAESYYSAEAALIMAHKWSNPARVEELLKVFESLASDSAEYKAAAEYRKRQGKGTLPEPIDPQHTVAEFTALGYGDYRFMMDM